MSCSLAMLSLLLAVAASAASGNGAAVVLRPVANMYSKASADADVVSQAIYGTRVSILAQAPGWAQVRTPDDYTGWMPADALHILGDGERAYASSGRVARVVSLLANLYREADATRHAPVLTLPFETALEVTAEPPEAERRWFRIALVDGRIAWVQRGDITLDDAPLSLDALVPFSRRFLGLPYLWGGVSTLGYDCSGLAQMLYRRIGILLPRDAQVQADWSGFVPVDRKDLRPGDLVYFGKSNRKITHTGMYLGSGEFISATTHEHPVVRIDKLDDPYWSKLVVAARRLK